RKIARPEGDSTIFAYDPATGNRQWQEDGRGAVSQVTFGYNSANQVISVTQPSNPPLRIGYDAVGNMDSVTTPLLYLTLYQNDGAGRTTVVRSPIDATHRKTDSTAYDLADHDTLVVSVGPQMSSTVLAETVFVRKHVNPNGQTDTLSRWGRPDVAGIGTITTKWSYDRAGRVIAEIAPDNVPDSMFYDAAGNDTLTVTRRGLRIRMAYDVLNRLATRILPPVSDSLRHSGITASFGYPETYPAYQVPADVQTFTYDPMGRILTANNADARVSRGYYTNGLLRADTLWVRTVQDTVFAQHRYITQYAYDLDGRRTGLTVPSDLEAHGLVSSSTYQYDPQFGALTSLSQSSDAFGFGYTGRGDVSSITFPGSFTEKFSYDPDDRIVTDTIR